ncbi:FAR1 DNA-binding domain [Sesbania bispinosa]|nr:FAR1 DNA-binding domain [Sesbania bispinosa]
MEENCRNNSYEGFNATTDFENDVEMVDVTDNPMEGLTDYSNTFTTNEIFGNRDELLKWVHETGRTHGFVVVILRSDAGGNGRKTTLVLGCERSGTYKPYKKELTRNVTGTKKCGCPFRLRGRPVHTGDGWRLNVVCGYHNHDVAENLEGHAYAGRLTTDEFLTHFVKVELKDGAPIPPTALQWRTSRLQDAEAWEFPYYKRMAAFTALFTRLEEQHVPIIIDLM